MFCGLEENFASIWENSLEGIRIINSEGNIFYVNESYCELVGIREEELIGKPFFFPYADINGESIEKLANKIKSQFEEQTLTPFNKIRVKFKNNRTCCLEITNSFINTADGERWLISIFKDTAAKKQSEFESSNYGVELQINLKDSKAFEIKTLSNSDVQEREKDISDLILDSIDDVIWIMDNNFKFTYISPSIKKLRGFSVEEAMSQSLEESLSENSLREVQNILVSTKDLDLSLIKEGILVEVQQPCKDGTLVWVEAKTKYIIDCDGKILGVLGISRDISDRKRAEALLIDSKNYLNRIINTVGDPLFVKDEKYNFVLVNDAFCKMVNKLKEEIIGKPDYEILDREECDFFHQQGDTLFKTGYENIIEEHFRDSENKKRIVLTRNTLFNDTGGNKYILGTMRDITELKKTDMMLRLSLEKEQQLNKLKSNFVSMVSHEFRTPLTTILSSSQFLEQYGSDVGEGEKKEIFSNIENGVQKMIALLDDILILGSTESGKFLFLPTETDLNKKCRDIIKEINISTAQKCAINYENLTEIKKFTLDKKLIRQALVNVLSNAVKYSPVNSTVDFIVRTDNDFLVFEIKDCGMGIPAEESSKIFEPFYRASNTENIAGTGLGLAIAKKSIELHSGTISFNSEEGKGTVFILRIPVC